MYPIRTARSRVAAGHRLPSPGALRSQIPLERAARQTVERGRAEISRILAGDDDRIVLVVGPCSVHDPAAALDYAERLAVLAREVAGSIVVVMRVYLEKPRTRLGWKGLISDPRLDGSHDLNSGLRLARGLMVQILQTGLPIGCEFLDPAVPSYIADAVSWGAIGARTVQSQIHRQLTSGLDMPAGIKNTTTGHVEDAIDAIVASTHGHVFPGIDDDGRAAVVTTTGNPDCHVVLRGGSSGPNFSQHDVARALGLLAAAGLPARVFIDASHGNSGKDHERQAHVVADVADRIAAGESGIAGVMIESFLTGGRQDLVLGLTDQLAFGKSITDSCASWDQTVQMVRRLAAAVAARHTSARQASAGQASARHASGQPAFAGPAH